MSAPLCIIRSIPTSFASTLIYTEKKEGPLNKDAIVELAEKSYNSVHAPLPILLIQAVSIAILFTAVAVGCVSLLPLGAACSQGMILSTHLITIVSAPIIAKINATKKSAKIADEKFLQDISLTSYPLKAIDQRNFTGLKIGSQIALVLAVIAHLSDYFLCSQPFVWTTTHLSHPRMLIFSIAVASVLILVTTLLIAVNRTKFSTKNVENEFSLLEKKLNKELASATTEKKPDAAFETKIKILNLQVDTLKTHLSVLKAS